jgi:hypothetical protein
MAGKICLFGKAALMDVEDKENLCVTGEGPAEGSHDTCLQLCFLLSVYIAGRVGVFFKM